MATPSLTIGITTFNRRGVLEAVSRSLARVDGLDRARLWVLDDCSHEFDADFLQRLFPQAEVFRAGTHSGGADQAMHRLFERFVTGSSGYLLNLDADMLVSRRLVDRCLEIVEGRHGGDGPCLFSLFNAPSHPAAGSNGEFLLKRTVGATGTLWEHGLLADVLRHVPVSRKFDWDWSAYLTQRGVPIRVTRRSYVQHIGRVGQHSRSLSGMDHGEDFDGYHDENLALYLDHTREGLLRMLADQQVRIDNQAKAIAQITDVVQSQARLIGALIESASERQAAA